jgi:hypothetical protein
MRIAVRETLVKPGEHRSTRRFANVLPAWGTFPLRFWARPTGHFSGYSPAFGRDGDTNILTRLDTQCTVVT